VAVTRLTNQLVTWPGLPVVVPWSRHPAAFALAIDCATFGVGRVVRSVWCGARRPATSSTAGVGVAGCPTGVRIASRTLMSFGWLRRFMRFLKGWRTIMWRARWWRDQTGRFLRSAVGAPWAPFFSANSWAPWGRVRVVFLRGPSSLLVCGSASGLAYRSRVVCRRAASAFNLRQCGIP